LAQTKKNEEKVRVLYQRRQHEKKRIGERWDPHQLGGKQEKRALKSSNGSE